MTAIIYAETAAGWFDKDRLTIKRSYGSTRGCAPRRELLYPSFSIPVSPSLAPLYGDPSLNRWDKSDSLAGIKREIWRPIGFLEVVPRYSGIEFWTDLVFHGWRRVLKKGWWNDGMWKWTSLLCEVSNRLRFKNYFFRENRKGEKW